MQLEMRRVTKALKSEWRSIEDYLLHKVFAIDASATDDAGRRCCDRASASGRRLVDNDFPYWFEEGIEHKLLWSAGGALSAAEVDAELTATLSADVERIWMLNSIAAQSVRGLWHVHVFIRRQKEAENDAAHHRRREEVVDVEDASNANESGGEGNAISSTATATLMRCSGVLLLNGRLWMELRRDLFTSRQILGDFWLQFVHDGRIVVRSHHRHEALDAERVQFQCGGQIAVAVGLCSL